jgi:hypothetical protein
LQTWARLLERAFGGEDVAAAPDDTCDDFWPVAPAPANADFIVDRLVDQANLQEPPDEREWVFLVGSAGNGKSVLAKRVSARLVGQKPRNLEPSLARRTYDYQSVTGQNVRIVNDATIPPERDQTMPGKDYLLQDLSFAVGSQAFLLVCINRGILLKERQAIALKQEAYPDIDRDVGAEIVSWLLDDTNQLRGKLEIQDIPDCAYYKFAKLSVGPRKVFRIHAVYLDQVSLLESAIKHASTGGDAWSENGALRPAKYHVMRYPDPGGRSGSPAAYLLEGLLETLGPMDSAAGTPSPFAANLAFFESPHCRAGWLSMLRSAEIATGKLLSYREIWGLAVLGLVGFNRGEFRQLDNSGKRAGPNSWLISRLKKLPRQTGMGQLLTILELASARTHMALFGHDIPRDRAFASLDKRAPAVVPTVKTMMTVDPVRDVVPGDEIMKQVHEAMRAISLDSRPSEFLKGSLQLNSESGHPFLDAWQPFDDLVEKIVLEHIHEHGIDSISRALQAWLARYLVRLCALALGRPAFKDVVSQLHESWERASRNFQLDQGLNQSLLSLINGNDVLAGSVLTPSILLPLLAPKAEPIVGAEQDALLAVNVPTRLSLKPRTDGDQVILDVYAGQLLVTSLILDFDLCREAMVFSGQGGFTERSHLAAPRIERVRAALLSEAVISNMSEQPGQRPELLAVKGKTRCPLLV